MKRKIELMVNCRYDQDTGETIDWLAIATDDTLWHIAYDLNENTLGTWSEIKLPELPQPKEVP